MNLPKTLHAWWLRLTDEYRRNDHAYQQGTHDGTNTTLDHTALAPPGATRWNLYEQGYLTTAPNRHHAIARIIIGRETNTTTTDHPRATR